MNVLDNLAMSYVLIDIDGTIKDLVKENTNALIRTMKALGNVNLKIRGKFVLWINKINMCFVKTGMLPTNKFMQNLLLFIYSLLLLKNYKKFKTKYFEEYNKENIFFADVDKMIINIHDKGLFIYMVTKNSQNQNMMAKNINEIKFTNVMKYVTKIIVGKKYTTKYAVYKSLMKRRYIQKREIIIIGDNFWDDVLPAILLGTKVVWCNIYNSKLKKVAISTLKLFNKNILDDDDLKVL